MSFEKQKKEIIYWSKLLNEKGFVTARSGNVSSKVDDKRILITAHDSYLGHLEEEDILVLDLQGNVLEGKLEPTSEKSLHLDIHKQFKGIKVVMHSHPPFTTAFFHYFDKLDIFSFEAKFYLGDIKAIPQDTPTVTDTKPVIKTLENTNIVTLKNHGVISMGKDFKEAFSLTELLEEQAKVNLMLKTKDQTMPAGRQEPTGKSENLEETRKASQEKYKMLSGEHRERLRELVNSDKEAQELGKKYDLSCTLAVKNQDTNEAMCFHYSKGKIIEVSNSDDAEFVIIGKPEILKRVFNREIDPFVALTQGKVKAKGDFAKMSKWYPVMVRTFKLWEQAPVE